MPLSINLGTTHRLHQQLLAVAQNDQASYQKICRHAGEVLAEQGTKFEGDKAMTFALSALCLDDSSRQALRTVAETLHGIVETAIDWVFASEDRFARFFPEHQRLHPWLKKTRGQSTWQLVSRYDAVVMPDGRIKIIELNTGCPAGFIHAEDFSHITQEALYALRIAGSEVGRDLGLEPDNFGTIPKDALVETLLGVESESQLPAGLIGLVNDENGLQNELALIVTAFEKKGRTARIIHAGEIAYRQGQATWRGQPISLMYNKIRISTANSPKHHWKPGFETRYAGFLESLLQEAVVAVNNLTGLTIAEDKGMLEVLRIAEFAGLLSPEQRQFVNDYVLWTVRLEDRVVDWSGQTVELLPFIRANREKFVIKPANEGRGFGVVVGKHATPEEWAAACEINPDLPCVVQEYAEAARLPVVRLQADEQLKIIDHHLTVGLAVLRGKSHGVLSRISANPVTNVGREGIVQAVLLTR